MTLPLSFSVKLVLLHCLYRGGLYTSLSSGLAMASTYLTLLPLFLLIYTAPPKDCYDHGWLHTYSTTASGVYYVYPDISPVAFIPVDVWCDMETDGGGWMVSRQLYSCPFKLPVILIIILNHTVTVTMA